ncbi:hypothetical protein [Halovenus sp. HT40]|uniref:hypothetical protein n=1 Tax=Halovenus sp. HT40 TaxID=3126691 RepID=UPI00300F65FE
MSATAVIVRLRQAAVGLYLCWLVAVVLSMLGRFTPFPTLRPARLGMIVGTAIFAVIGAGMVLRDLGDRFKKGP